MSGRLTGMTVLLTREGGLADELRSLGALVRMAEVTRFEAVLHSFAPEEFDWVVFTSARAVTHGGVPFDAGLKVASVGPATSREIERAGGTVDLEPATHDAASLCRELAERFEVRGMRVYFPCSDLALPTVPDLLHAAGAVVTRRIVYRTVPVDRLPEAATGPADATVFLSPSAVDAFADLGGDLFAAPALAIGPTTAEALRRRGVEPLVAPTSDRAGIIAAIVALEVHR